MIVLLALLAIVAGPIYAYLTWNYDHWTKLDVPHLKPKLFYGNLPKAESFL